jgi:hypothetical protein
MLIDIDVDIDEDVLNLAESQKDETFDCGYKALADSLRDMKRYLHVVLTIDKRLAQCTSDEEDDKQMSDLHTITSESLNNRASVTQSQISWHE